MLFVLCIAIFTFFLSIYMFIPFFALYIKNLGGNYMEFALVLSVTGFLLSIAQSYIGYLSDKFGSRFLVIVGGTISSLGLLATSILYSRNFIAPFYIIVNIGMGIVVPSVFTLISYKKTTKGDSFIPFYRSIQGAGVIVGPILGGFMMEYSYRLNIILSSIMMIISIVFFTIYFFIQHGDTRNSNGYVKSDFYFKEALLDVLHNKSFIIIILLFTCIEFSYDLINMSLPIVSLELNLDTNITGMALSAYFLMFTIFQIPINNVLKRFSKRFSLMFMGILSLIICSLLLINLPTYSILFIMGGIGLTIGSLFTFCSVLAADESPGDKKGTYMGIFNTIMPFTDVVSPLVVALLVGINIKYPYAVAVILIALFIILVGFFYSDKRDI